jgi:hypothetical protein
MVKATVVLDRMGATSVSQNGLSPEAVAQTLLDLNGSRNVAVTISPEGADERLMVAVDGSRALVEGRRIFNPRSLGTAVSLCHRRNRSLRRRYDLYALYRW